MELLGNAYASCSGKYYLTDSIEEGKPVWKNKDGDRKISTYGNGWACKDNPGGGWFLKTNDADRPLNATWPVPIKCIEY